jgi:hypothetical protein
VAQYPFRIEPLLYTRVSIAGLQEKVGNGAAILRAIETKSSDSFPRAVRHLYLFAYDWTLFNSRTPGRWTDAELRKFLSACTGVVTLMLIGDLAKPSLLPMVANMRRRRLHLLANLTSPHLDLTAPLFADVTHLFLGDSSRRGDVIDANWLQLPDLAQLPSLTHLALQNCTAAEVLSNLLTGCPLLRILILCAQRSKELDAIHDPRLVFMSETQNSAEEWNLGCRGEEDMWVRADAFIMQRGKEEA